MSLLYSPLKIRGLNLKNRIVVSPMCQYSSENGLANEWHLVHLGSRAVGGAGLVITEAAAIAPKGRISPADLGIWSEEHIAPLERITKFIKKQGSATGIQLAHAGRKASTQPPWEGRSQVKESEGGWQRLAPSSIGFREEDVPPKELSIEEIREIIDLFVLAAKRSVIAGFDVIEIHAAHGYLLNQFMSPLTNKRKDDYGGSFENRMRMLKEVTAGIRAVIPEEMPLFVRISAEEWAPGGHGIKESIEVSSRLKSLGVDLIDCSSGGVVKEQNIPVAVNYQLPFAEKIKKKVNIATGAVGLITDVAQAEEILKQHQADLIFIGREMLRNPYFALVEAGKILESPVWPKQYERAKP